MVLNIPSIFGKPQFLESYPVAYTHKGSNVSSATLKKAEYSAQVNTNYNSAWYSEGEKDTGLTINVECQEGDSILLMFTANAWGSGFSNANSPMNMYFVLNKDGTNIDSTKREISGNDSDGTVNVSHDSSVCITHLDSNVSEGTHTYKVRWKCMIGAFTSHFHNGNLVILKLQTEND